MDYPSSRGSSRMSDHSRTMTPIGMSSMRPPSVQTSASGSPNPRSSSRQRHGGGMHVSIEEDTGSFPGGQIDYDSLDRARDRADMGVDGVGEYRSMYGGVGTSGDPNQGRGMVGAAPTSWGLAAVRGGHREGDGEDEISTLEQNLELKRQRMREIEGQLLEARSSKEADKKMGSVRRQGRVLDNVMGHLSQLTREELNQRYAIEDEWRMRIESFEKQHREMEDALRRRHATQLKRLKKDIEREMTILGKQYEDESDRAPSPRTMARIQAENMERMGKLFHMQAEERAHLDEKVSRQEELLVQSKNQAMDRLAETSRSRSRQVYQRYGVQHSIQDATLTLSNSEGLRGRSAATPMSVRLGAGTPLLPSTPATRRFADAAGRSVLPETSPRVDTAASTFLTEMLLPEEFDSGVVADTYGTHESYGGGEGVEDEILRLASGGAGGNESESGTQMGKSEVSSRAQTAVTEMSWDMDMTGRGGGGSRGGGTWSRGGREGGGGGKPARRSKLSYGDQASHEVQYPTQPKLPDYGPVFHPGASAPMPGTVSSGWRPFIDEQPGSTLQKPPKNGGKKSFLSQLTTLAYETPASAMAGGQYGEGGRGKTKTKSPYLISLVGNRGRVGNNNNNNTASRRKSHATASGMGAQGSPKSGSAFGGKAGHSHSPEGKRLSFPRLGASSKETSPKGARTGLQGDSETRFSQLEGWVDEKIKKSLGETLAKEGIDVKQLSAGEGGRREVVQTVHQGRRGSISMVGSNRRRSVVGPVDDGEAKEVEQQDIGGLISRLKNTITSDAEKREPSKIPLRKGDDLKTEGVKVMDAKQLATTTGEKVKKNQGRSVPQDADAEAAADESKQLYDENSRIALATRVVPVSKGAEDRRSQLSLLEEQAGSKKVDFELEEGEKGESRLESHGFSRVGTEASGMTGLSRPTTGFSTLASTAPNSRQGQREEADVLRVGTATTAHTDREDIGVDEEEEEEDDDHVVEKVPEGKLVYTEKEFFVWVTRNKFTEVQLALMQGRDVDKRDDFGNTALMRAAQNGHFRMAKLCFKFDAEPNVQNHQGNTALHFAIGYKYSRVVELLREHGADDLVMNNKGVPASKGLE